MKKNKLKKRGKTKKQTNLTPLPIIGFSFFFYTKNWGGEGGAFFFFF
jgi:hypothetical protein